MTALDARIRDLANDTRAVARLVRPSTVGELAVRTELLTLADRLEHAAKLARTLGHNAASRKLAPAPADPEVETVGTSSTRFARSDELGNGAAGDSNPGPVSFPADDGYLAADLARSADGEAVATPPASLDPSAASPSPDGLGVVLRLPARSVASPPRSAGPVYDPPGRLERVLIRIGICADRPTSAWLDDADRTQRIREGRLP